MDMNLSFSVLTADIISILLIGTLYLANRQKAEYNRDMRLLHQMMVTIGIANISDCCVYYLTGSSNIVIKVLVFLSGSGLFLGNVMIGYLWAKLYNRVYLEFLHKRACNKKDCWVSGIMIDLNGFKQINDNYTQKEIWHCVLLLIYFGNRSLNMV